MSTDLANDTIFAGRYRISRCIAAGGMGAVYEVVHIETERKRALKVMHAHIVSSAELRDRFRREARVAAQIDSDYIVDVFDAGVDEATQTPFLVMELLKGEELGKRLERVGRFAATEAISYLWQTALALDKTHKANIVHRDLKPENLFLTQRDDAPPRVKILDFGVAKFVAETGTQSNVTRSVGTPLYMGPEQFLGQNVTSACDNYALGMMAYTLLVGDAYWSLEAERESTVFAFANHVMQGPRIPASVRASSRRVSLPSDFDAWFWKATNANPAERFPSATATITALGRVFGLDPARLTGVGASDPFSRPSMSGGATGTVVIGDESPRVSQSGALSAITNRTNTGGVVTPVQAPRSRTGVVLAVVLGVAILGGGGMLTLSMRGHAQDVPTPAVPAAEVTTTPPTAAPNVIPAATTTPSAIPPPEPTATTAPSAELTASAGAIASASPVRSSVRAPSRSQPAAPSNPQPPPAAAAPAAPPPPATKQPAYTRD